MIIVIILCQKVIGQFNFGMNLVNFEDFLKILTFKFVILRDEIN